MHKNPVSPAAREGVALHNGSREVPPCCVPGSVLVVEHRYVRDADDRVFRRLQSGYGLPPRLGPRRVYQRESRLLELLYRSDHGRGVPNIELDTYLWHGPPRRPLLSAEARLGGLGQGPDAERLATTNLLAVLIVAGVAGKRQPERIDVQFAALQRIRRDDRHGREELDVHVASSSGLCVFGHTSESQGLCEAAPIRAIAHDSAPSSRPW